MRHTNSNTKSNTTTRHGAFTLVELLVVIVIIGVLAGIIIPAVAAARMVAKRAACISNLRQIGTGLLLYANDHKDNLPVTTHNTYDDTETWIYQLKPYVGNVDEIRVCPAEPAARKKRIIDNHGTSYVLNDQVVEKRAYRRITGIPNPSRTLLACILSEAKNPATTQDHIHGGGWSTWNAVKDDIDPDRHRFGARSPDKLAGTSNYLYVDGHVKNIKATDFKAVVDSGINPAAVPE
ncbi:MAG: type II secretion system GspH family protein [Opitutaceae bacterium]|jgi:prepilin-type N-terminal cleavage/methylation domain-containing protein/prepilin-type processing-associated H-X9-DG protein|nr:type II secretion system GspH family protein [Opitutaceae bacterium]